jgi:hypothetical protein
VEWERTRAGRERVRAGREGMWGGGETGSKGRWTLNKGSREISGQVLGTHACNPSYSGGREQEDHVLKPVWTNSLQDPISKKPITERGWWNGSKM